MRVYKIFLLLIFFAFISCLDIIDEPPETTNFTEDNNIASGEMHSYTIEAKDAWKYFSLKNGSEVDIENEPKSKTNIDAVSRATNTAWDIAFLAQHIKTNSGDSSTGGGGGTYKTEATSIEDITETPDYFSVITDTTMSVYDYDSQNIISLSLNPLLNGCEYEQNCNYLPWYEQNNTQLSPRLQAYILRGANGGFYKFQIIKYENKATTFQFEKMD